MDIYPIITTILSIAAFCDGHCSTFNNLKNVKDFGKLIWNIRLRSTYLQFHPTTLRQCAKECLIRRGRCKSINFSRKMSFCELNYKNLSDNQTAEKAPSFEYSDISTWSKDMIGKCKNKVCNKKKRCSIKTGKCSLSDCGPVDFDIPKNSILQNHGHHEIGNAVDFICKKGYKMYNKNTHENLYVSTIRCNSSGHWENVEFVCLACDRKTLHTQTLVELIENNSSLVNEEYALQCASGYMPYINGTTKADSVTVKCNIQTHKWERPDFLCNKCDPISFEFPENSVLQNNSHHSDGDSLNFTCKDGYLMYNNNTNEHIEYGIMKCNASGQWGNVEFVCLDQYPSHCQGISYAQLAAGDVHKIYPFGNNISHEVTCKVIGKHAWTVIQKRFDGTEDFYRSWEEYKHGFGNTTGEYWIGNDVLHALTSEKTCQLLVELEDWKPITAKAFYRHFRVGNEKSKYKLSASGYSGTAGDSMKENNGRVFSTKDRNVYTTDNGERCAEKHKSGWWHGKYSTWCPYGNLNGLYSNVTIGYSTMYWYSWFTDFTPIKSSTMMIRY